MPLNEIPAFFHPKICSFIDSTLEQAWLELRKDKPNDEVMARRKLATTIVALAAIGETDPAKLKRFVVHATRAAGLGVKPAVQKLPERVHWRPRFKQLALSGHFWMAMRMSAL